MIRKSIFALAAIATVTAVSFASSSPAEARRWHGHGWGVGAFVVGVPVITSCVQYQWVETRRGWVQVPVNVC